MFPNSDVRKGVTVLSSNATLFNTTYGSAFKVPKKFPNISVEKTDLSSYSNAKNAKKYWRVLLDLSTYAWVYSKTFPNYYWTFGNKKSMLFVGFEHEKKMCGGQDSNPRLLA